MRRFKLAERNSFKNEKSREVVGSLEIRKVNILGSLGSKLRIYTQMKTR